MAVCMGLMYWMGPAPALIVAGVLQPLAKPLPILERVQLLIIYSGIPLTAVMLAIQMLRLVRHLAQWGAT